MEGSVLSYKLVLSPVLFRVCDRKKSYVLHHVRLKPCEDRDIPLWLRRKRSRLLDQGDPEGTAVLGETNPESDLLYLDQLFGHENSNLSTQTFS